MLTYLIFEKSHKILPRLPKVKNRKNNYKYLKKLNSQMKAKKDKVYHQAIIKN